MSLRDGTKKMSKSDISDNSRINLTDEIEVIYDKIIKSKTDSIPIVIKIISRILFLIIFFMIFFFFF
jgi:tryptophanyl-tRNA synthetase